MIVRSFVIYSSSFAILLGMATVLFAARIESDPSKNYELTKNRGPWMISVATFHTTDPKGETKSGKTPEQAAQELILELRRLGMPAYVYIHDPGSKKVTVTDRIGREEVRKNLTRLRTVLVLAGNYEDINDKVAQDSLKWVKKLNPESLQEGVKFAPTKARPTPLSGAFLTVNPLLSESDLTQTTRDPLLIKLNSGENHSLTENRGEYTLVVGRFFGKQVTVKPGSKIPSVNEFLSGDKGNDLDEAAMNARDFVTVLRGKYDPEGNFNNLEAFIWHDRSESIVTVGSFASENDPAIARYKKMFGPRLETFPDGQTSYQPGHFQINGFGKARDQVRMWIFEPNPYVMRVPRLK